jgi:DNA helicase-2/ATP-dependent DNA helicase PcrA
MTGHDGIFQVNENDFKEYIKEYRPVVLRHSVKAKTQGLEGFNFGSVKGLSFDRVMIFPTEDIKTFLRSGTVDKLAEGTRAKLYVAITRARFSVAFFVDSLGNPPTSPTSKKSFQNTKTGQSPDYSEALPP